VVVTIATGGFAAPAALAWGGFAAGFSGTLINGGSIGQAFGMGFVGAFAGGVGGVAFQGLKDFARIAALTAIGATAGASGAAIMGGNIGLGAAAGAAAGFIGGAVGGRLQKWDPGLARTAAGMASAAGGGAASAAIAGGSPGMGAGLGAFAVATAAAARNFQAMIDAGQQSGATEGRSAAGARGTRWAIRPEAPEPYSEGAVGDTAGAGGFGPEGDVPPAVATAKALLGLAPWQGQAAVQTVELVVNYQKHAHFVQNYLADRYNMSGIYGERGLTLEQFQMQEQAQKEWLSSRQALENALREQH